VALALLEDVFDENILQQRQRHTPQPGPLHLTRRADLLEIELPPADISLYDQPIKS